MFENNSVIEDAPRTCLVHAEIPFKVESLNKFTTGHWRKWHAYKKKLQNALSFRIGWGDKPETMRYLKIESVRTRLLDDDNLRGGAKPIPDIFEKKHWIKNDTINFVHVTYEQRKKKKGESECTIAMLSDHPFG